jgi:hypothetical protein
MDSADRLTKVNQYINKIWNKVLNQTIDTTTIEEAARRIQDEFYDNRIKSPLILDSFYGF